MNQINLYAGTQIQHVHNGDDIVIFQGENEAQSVFYGRRLTYLATERGIAKFAFKRNFRTESVNGKVVYPISIPQNFNGGLRTVDRTRTYEYLNLSPQHSTDVGRFANESYDVVEYTNEQCSIFLSIAEEDFTFMLASEFERTIVINQAPLPIYENGMNLLSYGIGGATIHSTGNKVWTRAMEAEVLDTYPGHGHPQGWYIKNIATQDWRFNEGIQSYGVVDIRVDSLRSETSQVGDIVITEMDTQTDEAFIEIGQLIRFTLPSRSPNRLVIMPQHKFKFQSEIKDAYFQLAYVYGTGATQSSRLILEPQQQEQTSVQFRYTANFGVSNTLSQDEIYRAIQTGRPAHGVDWATFYQGLVSESQPMQEAPVPQKYAVGTVVTAEVERKSHIPFRFKNREWKITGYRGYSNGAKQHQYVLTPNVKKNINKSSDVTAYENEITPIEKILKRKFKLARTIGKYRQGRVFTKDELVTTFAKFQDAQDPFILNKIYICAESPSEKSEL